MASRKKWKSTWREGGVFPMSEGLARPVLTVEVYHIGGGYVSIGTTYM
jgi:hypothetical protein